MKNDLLETLIIDYTKGGSLNTLSERHNLPKSTIYYNLLKSNIVHRQNKISKLKSNNSLLIGTFIGLWIGDGSKFISKGYIIKIHLHKDNKNLINLIKNIVFDLFNLKVKSYSDGGNKACVKICSKFVYNFIDNYVRYDHNKTFTVSLRNSPEKYNKNFLNGLILGLALSDGSISGGKFSYATISNKLRENVCCVLRSQKYSSVRYYVHKRDKYGWKDLNLVYLNTNETRILIKRLNFTLTRIGFPLTFPLIKSLQKV